jgi:hypothetical protein
MPIYFGDWPRRDCKWLDRCKDEVRRQMVASNFVAGHSKYEHVLRCRALKLYRMQRYGY